MALLMIVPGLGKVFDFFNIGIFPRYIKKFFMKVVEKTVTMREVGKEERVDILQLMIEAHQISHEEESTETTKEGLELSGSAEEKKSLQSQSKGMTNTSSTKKRPMELDELMANSVLFFLAGYETTNTALCFCSYVLATHPEIQDKLIEEVDEKAPTRDDVTYDIMSSMEYLDCFIMETLRYYPPISA